MQSIIRSTPIEAESGANVQQIIGGIPAKAETWCRDAIDHSEYPDRGRNVVQTCSRSSGASRPKQKCGAEMQSIIGDILAKAKHSAKMQHIFIESLKNAEYHANVQFISQKIKKTQKYAA
jgi:hypothetical protein